MITVRELAAECCCSADEVLIQLTTLHVLTLGPDSFVRDEDAAKLRRTLAKSDLTSSAPPTSESEQQLRALREKLSASLSRTESRDARQPVTPFEMELRRVEARSLKKPKGKHWYPDNDPLCPLEEVIADRVVSWGERTGRKVPGMIFFDELQTIKRIHRKWAQACIEAGHLMSDERIIQWLRTFPRHQLDPRQVIEVDRAGITPSDAALHLWYGRESPSRPTLFDRICLKDITVEEAKTQIDRHKHAG